MGDTWRLTRRQIDTIVKVAKAGAYARTGAAREPGNLTAVAAQLAYRGRGNPPVSHPTSAISNCFPGLEFDFRNIWRRLFKGIVLTEHNNYVVEVEDSRLNALLHCRLLAVEGHGMMTVAKGPFYPGGGNQNLPVDGNPEAVAFMEWSNNFARFQDKQGQTVSCVFTAAPPPSEIELVWPRPERDTLALQTIDTRGAAHLRRRADGRRSSSTRGAYARTRQPGRADAGALLTMAERLSRVRLLLLGGLPAGLRQR